MQRSIEYFAKENCVKPKFCMSVGVSTIIAIQVWREKYVVIE